MPGKVVVTITKLIHVKHIAQSLEHHSLFNKYTLYHCPLVRLEKASGYDDGAEEGIETNSRTGMVFVQESHDKGEARTAES